MVDKQDTLEKPWVVRQAEYVAGQIAPIENAAIAGERFDKFIAWKEKNDFTIAGLRIPATSLHDAIVMEKAEHRGDKAYTTYLDTIIHKVEEFQKTDRALDAQKRGGKDINLSDAIEYAKPFAEKSVINMGERKTAGPKNDASDNPGFIAQGILDAINRKPEEPGFIAQKIIDSINGKPQVGTGRRKIGPLGVDAVMEVLNITDASQQQSFRENYVRAKDAAFESGRRFKDINVNVVKRNLEGFTKNSTGNEAVIKLLQTEVELAGSDPAKLNQVNSHIQGLKAALKAHKTPEPIILLPEANSAQASQPVPTKQMVVQPYRTDIRIKIDVNAQEDEATKKNLIEDLKEVYMDGRAITFNGKIGERAQQYECLPKTPSGELQFKKVGGKEIIGSEQLADIIMSSAAAGRVKEIQIGGIEDRFSGPSPAASLRSVHLLAGKPVAIRSWRNEKTSFLQDQKPGGGRITDHSKPSGDLRVVVAENIGAKQTAPATTAVVAPDVSQPVGTGNNYPGGVQKVTVPPAGP